MSADYFLEQLNLRWNWGNLDDSQIATRSKDILDDWRKLTPGEADAAVQLLRRREYHKGNFMPSADEIESAVNDARTNRGASNVTAFRPADPLVRKRHSVTGKDLGARASRWPVLEAHYGSVNAVIDAWESDGLASLPRGLTQPSRRMSGDRS